MAETADIATVRLLIADTASDAAKQILTNDQIGSFLTLEDDNIKLAAAQALDAIASSEALVSKKIRTQDLSTDGPAVAKALREHAVLLRAQAYDGDEGYVEIVDLTGGACAPELAPGSWLL